MARLLGGLDSAGRSDSRELLLPPKTATGGKGERRCEDGGAMAMGIGLLSVSAREKVRGESEEDRGDGSGGGEGTREGGRGS